MIPYPSTQTQGSLETVHFDASCPACGHTDALWTNCLRYARPPSLAVSCEGCGLEVTWNTATGMILAVAG